MGTDTDFGPPVRGGQPREGRSVGRVRPPGKPRGRRRTGRRVFRAALVLAVLMGLIPLALLLTASLRMDKVAIDGLASGGAPVNVLLAGSDSREGMSREEQLELSTGSQGGDLTDTIIVASMQGNRAALLAFPRDLYVTRCDGSQGRINAAVHVGGPECLVDTVSELSGLPIHHYMEIRFLGFRDVVDALGGVEMCLDEPIRDANAGLDLPAGCQVLDGGDSLGYVRVRGIDDDFGRMDRQQEFLQVVASEATEPRTLINIPKMFRVAAEGGDALLASDSVGPFSLARIGWGLRGLAGGAPTHTVPGSPASVGGASVLQPIASEAEPLFERFRSGAVLDEAAAHDAGIAPEDVSVTVLNGSGASGLAGSVAEQLEAHGYSIAAIGNADPLDQTVVRHPEGQEEQARLVAAEAPGDVTVEEASVSSVTLILGSDASPR